MGFEGRYLLYGENLSDLYSSNEDIDGYLLIRKTFPLDQGSGRRVEFIALLRGIDFFNRHSVVGEVAVDNRVYLSYLMQ